MVLSRCRAVRGILISLVCVVAGHSVSHAQVPGGRVTALVTQDSTAIQGALVRAGAVSATTNRGGRASLALPAGPARVIVSRIGLRPDSIAVIVRPGLDTLIVVRLVAQAATIAPVFVTTTRAERRLEEEPLRVEVLSGEDVSEKSEMHPADSRTLLSELSGVRLQARSPLGATNIRIQGLPGRYTAVLSDGLPLYGGQASGFTLVDVVPLDLRQAEVIKGAASALYGPQALSGVVNLVSRRLPDSSAVLLNQSAPSGTDAMAFAVGSLRPSLGVTLLAGVHSQRLADEDRDGWANVPGFRRAELRPRVFLDDSAGHSIMFTAGGFAENRSAGSVGSVPAGLPGPRSPFSDSLATRHGDVGIVGQWRSSATLSFSLRASAARETRTHVFGDLTDRDDRGSLFGELSASRTFSSNILIAGAAALQDEHSNVDLPRFNLTRTTPAIFVQDTYTPVAWLAATANGRCDDSSTYGTICTPRLSLLVHRGNALSARLSAGDGWFAPTPITDETETFSLARVRIVQPLSPERGRSASFDLTATHGPLQVNGTLFTNRITDPVGLRRVPGDTTGLVDLVNASGPLTTHGGEVFAVFNQEPFIVTAYYSATRSREISPETGQLRELPLTPRETAGVDFALEDDESGASAAVEVFYTGRQSLEDNPYAQTSKPYTTVGILLSDRWRAVTVFLNGENLGNVRLTHFHPLLRAKPGEGGRWTVDPWAPLEGRRMNVGLRWHW
jgi:outer membrane receptor for ferrienterochelin and colicins